MWVVLRPIPNKREEESSPFVSKILVKSPKPRNKVQRKVDYKNYDAKIMSRNYYMKFSASILWREKCGNYRDIVVSKNICVQDIILRLINNDFFPGFFFFIYYILYSCCFENHLKKESQFWIFGLNLFMYREIKCDSSYYTLSFFTTVCGDNAVVKRRSRNGWAKFVRRNVGESIGTTFLNCSHASAKLDQDFLWSLFIKPTFY